MEILFCDRCNASVSLPSLQAGEALSLPRVTLCQRCAREVSVGESILRCEHCKRGFELGSRFAKQISVVQGALVCDACAGVRPESPAGSDRKRFRVILYTSLLVALLVVAVMVSWIVFDGLPLGGDPNLSHPGAAVVQRAMLEGDDHRILKSVLDTLYDLDDSIEAIRAEVTQLQSLGPDTERDATDSSIGELREEALRARVFIAEDLEFHGLQIDDIATRLDRITERLTALEAMSLEKAETEVTTEGAEPVESARSGEDPAVAQWLGDLSSGDPGARFSAVIELGRRGDVRVLGAIAKVMLADDDPLVREQAARCLGGFRDRAAVPSLLKALLDSAAFVGLEAAAALRDLTRKDFGFTQKASAAERRAAVSRWEQWWVREAKQ